MRNSIEYSENCSQISGSLWQYYRDQPNLNDDCNIIDFPVNDNTSLSLKQKNTTGRTENDGMKKVEKTLEKLRTLETLLINSEINLILTLFVIKYQHLQ